MKKMNGFLPSACTAYATGYADGRTAELMNEMCAPGSISVESKGGRVCVRTSGSEVVLASLLAHVVNALRSKGIDREVIGLSVQAGLDSVSFSTVKEKSKQKAKG